MAEIRWPQVAEKFEIQQYKQPTDLQSLMRTHVPFSGSPRKHPLDGQKVIIIPDPYSTCAYYFEFRAEDISYAEELPSLVNIRGETVPMARVWVKKKSVGLSCSPFIVEEAGEDPGKC